MTSAYRVRSEMRMAPRTDISASRSCGGAPMPGTPGASGGAARAVSGGGGMTDGGRRYQRARSVCTCSCRTFRGSRGESLQRAREALQRPREGRGRSLLLLFDDERLDGRRHAVGDLDDDHVGADVLDRLLEVDLPAVDLQAAGVADRVGDVLGGDRAEQPPVLARLLRDGQDGAREDGRA